MSQRRHTLERAIYRECNGLYSDLTLTQLFDFLHKQRQQAADSSWYTLRDSPAIHGFPYRECFRDTRQRDA